MGRVVDERGPVEGATVRVQATENKTTTGHLGAFFLSSIALSTPVTVTAWAEGYFVGWETVTRDNASDVTITLKPTTPQTIRIMTGFPWKGLTVLRAAGTVCQPILNGLTMPTASLP